MRTVNDRDYYLKRATEEQQLAASSADRTAAAIHAFMATAYRRRASEPARVPEAAV